MTLPPEIVVQMQSTMHDKRTTAERVLAKVASDRSNALSCDAALLLADANSRSESRSAAARRTIAEIDAAMAAGAPVRSMVDTIHRYMNRR